MSKKNITLQREKAEYRHTMIGTDRQHFPDPDDVRDIFDEERDSLSARSKISQISERASLYDGFKKSGDHRGTEVTTSRIATAFPQGTGQETFSDPASDWKDSLENETLDLILTASSLTEGSFFSLDSECDAGEEGILSTGPFEEEFVDSRKSGNDDDCEDCDDGLCTISSESTLESTHDDTRNEDDRIIPAETVRKAGRSISYAQLFFDPETKTLVTLMEIANVHGSAHCGDGLRRHRTDSGSKSDISLWDRSCISYHKKHSPSETPLHRSPLVMSKYPNDGSSKKDTRGDNKTASNFIYDWNHNMQDVEDHPFQDDTISTECSSMSSETFRRHDSDDFDGNDHKLNRDVNGSWTFPSTHHEDTSSPIRFSDEPIVFSNDTSMSQKLRWLDEADIGLYLLHECDDPWDYGAPSRGANIRCGESLKKFLNASRLCISLPQLGESKWRASSNYHRALDPPNGDHQHYHKPMLERPSYSALHDM